MDRKKIRHKKNQWRASASVVAVVAIVSSFLLTLAGYIYGNNAFPIFDDIEQYSELEYARRLLFNDATATDDNVLFVNVGYDKSLIECYDEFDMPLGNIAITDRRKLADFLEALEGTNYKYIFLDVRFEKDDVNRNFYVEGDSTSGTVDEHLTQVIERTPRIVIAAPHSREFLNDTIKQKSALSEFSSTITATNFVRYPYLASDGSTSVPHTMYHELCGREIKRRGIFYFDDGHLCNICPFFQIKQPFVEYDEDNVRQYLNLGADILDLGLDVKEYAEGKVVVIGDFVNDVHDTYVGPQPGSYLSYLAYKSLCDGNHLVKWWSHLLMGILYILIAVFAFSKRSVLYHIPFIKNHVTRFVRAVVNFLGIAFVLTTASCIIYFINGETYALWFPTIYFTILQTIVTYKES